MARSRHPVRIFDTLPPPEITSRYMRVWLPQQCLSAPHLLPPLNAQGLFGNPDAPLEIDIGCGIGDFCIELAQRHPQRCIVGFERSFKPLYRAMYAAHDTKLDNILFIKTDFRVLVPLLVERSLQAVYYHFPPPYVKARHDRTGIFGPRLLAHLYRALHPGGFISVITDAPLSYEHFCSTALASTLFELNTAGPFRVHFDEPLKSFHHRKWEQQGRAVQRFELYPITAQKAEK